MTQVLDALNPKVQNPILCSYCNRTSRIQVVRIANIPGWYFERVVFPGEYLCFEAVPEGQLEVHTSGLATAVLADTIACDRLRVQEVEPVLPNPY